jgi:hypothetical protein
MDHYADRLRNPGFGGSPDVFPVSGKGGGRSAVHVGARPLANLILSLAAIGPSGAVEAQARLRRLQCDPGRRKTYMVGNALAMMAPGQNETIVPTPPEVLQRTLGERIEAIIIDVAQAVRRPDGGSELERMEASNLHVNLSPANRHAFVSWRDDEGSYCADMYSEPQANLLLVDHLLSNKPQPLKRATGLDFPIFLTAGRLLADTLNREAIQRSRPRRLSRVAESKTPGPSRDRAPLTDRQDQQGPATEILTDSETTRERDGAQLDRARRLFVLPDQPSNPDGKGMSDGPRPHSPCLPAA